MDEKVKAAIEEIRPLLKRDGGDIEFVSYSNGIVKVRLRGACHSCPMSQMTLKGVVEKTLKSKIPEIKSVETV
ncbi:MAG: NifU family protein [Candidatus Omnitrophica bacterium]|nr:NifU family protein [Candidatus Omnitrophota bacterium]